MPCPEVVAVSYIRQAEVPTLFSVEGDAQVEQKNHKCRFLTLMLFLAPPLEISRGSPNLIEFPRFLISLETPVDWLRTGKAQIPRKAENHMFVWSVMIPP